MLPDMQEPAKYVDKKRLSFHDGTSRLVYATQVNFPYPSGQLIISRTDLKGTITHCNDAFVVLSGYSKEELMGAPHHIIRHPDMPRAAFKDLWDTLFAGKRWHGYVKNLRKDGAHYWVYATAVPSYRNGELDGFTSVRREPAKDKIEYFEKLYKQMRMQEEQA